MAEYLGVAKEDFAFDLSTIESKNYKVGAWADGVVVGSAFVDVIEQSPSRDAAVEAVSKLVGEPLRPFLRLPGRSRLADTSRPVERRRPFRRPLGPGLFSNLIDS